MILICVFSECLHLVTVSVFADFADRLDPDLSEWFCAAVALSFQSNM